MAWTQEKIETTLKSVVEKAQADPSFRKKLKKNPCEVLVSEANEAIPESFRIGVVDQNDVDLVITLPKVQINELSDADLEHVAGGKPDKKPVQKSDPNRNILAEQVCLDYKGQSVQFGNLMLEYHGIESYVY